jgi:hypothetical protein
MSVEPGPSLNKFSFFQIDPRGRCLRRPDLHVRRQRRFCLVELGGTLRPEVQQMGPRHGHEQQEVVGRRGRPRVPLHRKNYRNYQAGSLNEYKHRRMLLAIRKYLAFILAPK